LYNQKLRETAAFTVDRGVLFEYITSDFFIESQAKTLLKEASEILIEEKEPIAVERKEIVKEDLQILISEEEAQQISRPDFFERIEEGNSITATADDFVEEEEEETEEETLVNTPLEFTTNETHSFSEWLKITTVKPIERTQEAKKTPKLLDKITLKKPKKLLDSSIVNNFIKNNPRISPANKDGTGAIVNLATVNNIATEDLMTETLAKVYLAQKNYKKAIQAYKILILKNPQKSGYFADQIRTIENL